MILAAPRLALRLRGRARTGWPSVRIMVSCQMSGGMILQWGSTTSEHLALCRNQTERYCRDMTEKLLKVKINQNKQTFLNGLTWMLRPTISCDYLRRGGGMRRGQWHSQTEAETLEHPEGFEKHEVWKSFCIFYYCSFLEAAMYFSSP